MARGSARAGTTASKQSDKNGEGDGHACAMGRPSLSYRLHRLSKNTGSAGVPPACLPLPIQSIVVHTRRSEATLSIPNRVSIRKSVTGGRSAPNWERSVPWGGRSVPWDEGPTPLRGRSPPWGRRSVPGDGSSAPWDGRLTPWGGRSVHWGRTVHPRVGRSVPWDGLSPPGGRPFPARDGPSTKARIDYQLPIDNLQPIMNTAARCRWKSVREGETSTRLFDNLEG